MLGLPAAGGGPVGEEPEPTTRALNVEIHRHGGHPKRRWVTRRRVTERSGLEENREREEHGKAVRFINAERKKRLTGPDMTASMIAEFLSMLGRLPPGIYRQLTKVRVARNRWLHRIEPTTHEVAREALGLAELMFGHVEDIEMFMPKGLSIGI